MRIVVSQLLTKQQSQRLAGDIASHGLVGKFRYGPEQRRTEHRTRDLVVRHRELNLATGELDSANAALGPVIPASGAGQQEEIDEPRCNQDTELVFREFAKAHRFHLQLRVNDRQAAKSFFEDRLVVIDQALDHGAHVSR